MKDCLVGFEGCDWDCVLVRFWFVEVEEVEEVEELLLFC